VGPDGLADVVPTTRGRFPPSAESLCTPPDRFGQFSKWRHVFISIAPGQAAEARPPGRAATEGPLDSVRAKAQIVTRSKRRSNAFGLFHSRLVVGPV
jgi:hypothetical protein